MVVVFVVDIYGTCTAHTYEQSCSVVDLDKGVPDHGKYEAPCTYIYIFIFHDRVQLYTTFVRRLLGKSTGRAQHQPWYAGRRGRGEVTSVRDRTHAVTFVKFDALPDMGPCWAPCFFVSCDVSHV